MNRSRVTGDLASHGNIFVDIDNDRVDRPPSVQSNRPLTGREARSARSSRIMSIQSQKKNLAVGGITGEEYQV